MAIFVSILVLAAVIGLGLWSAAHSDNRSPKATIASVVGFALFWGLMILAWIDQAGANGP